MLLEGNFGFLGGKHGVHEQIPDVRAVHPNRRVGNPEATKVFVGHSPHLGIVG